MEKSGVERKFPAAPCPGRAAIGSFSPQLKLPTVRKPRAEIFTSQTKGLETNAREHSKIWSWWTINHWIRNQWCWRKDPMRSRRLQVFYLTIPDVRLKSAGWRCLQLQLARLPVASATVGLQWPLLLAMRPFTGHPKLIVFSKQTSNSSDQFDWLSSDSAFWKWTLLQKRPVTLWSSLTLSLPNRPSSSGAQRNITLKNLEVSSLFFFTWKLIVKIFPSHSFALHNLQDLISF